MNYYERFKKLCETNAISPTALLKKLNISTSKQTAWEKGSMPNSKFVILISEYFGVTTDYLLKGKEPQTTEQLRSDQQELLDNYKKLPEREQGRVLQFMADIINSQQPTDNNTLSFPDSDPAVQTAALDQKKRLA